MSSRELKFQLRVAAIVLISAGYGWSGGHFIPENAPWFAYLFQIIILLIIIFLTIGYLVGMRKWSINGISIFAVLSLLINIGNIVHGAFSHTATGFGSHNTFADLVPISIIILGNLLWLVTIFLSNRASDSKKK